VAVIITGCGHRGLENTIRHCRNITREENVYAVIGGLHLRTASPLKLINLMKFLREIKPEKLWMPLHGTMGQTWLKDKYRLSCGIHSFDA
jgi:7,8-dihydropterin-6-yl-methyl-4-(beta-D-ribofuranosyl)aminobenzene 5'-phosphate synthase